MFSKFTYHNRLCRWSASLLSTIGCADVQQVYLPQSVVSMFIKFTYHNRLCRCSASLLTTIGCVDVQQVLFVGHGVGGGPGDLDLSGVRDFSIAHADLERAALDVLLVAIDLNSVGALFTWLKRYKTCKRMICVLALNK
jgi:hypothetical protein